MIPGIPKGFHSISPYMVLKDAAAAIEFYKKAFGAVEVSRLEIPGSGLIMHAQIQIGDSRLMLMDVMECPGGLAKSPLELEGSPISLHLYVENVDEAFKKALAAGAQEIMPVQDMFWGDRYGRLKDPFGYEWSLATQLREMTSAEVQEAANECFKQLQPAH